jgi:hypothetical protein
MQGVKDQEKQLQQLREDLLKWLPSYASSLDDSMVLKLWENGYRSVDALRTAREATLSRIILAGFVDAIMVQREDGRSPRRSGCMQLLLRPYICTQWMRVMLWHWKHGKQGDRQVWTSGQTPVWQ